MSEQMRPEKVSRRRRFAQLTGREYLPMFATIALWSVIVVVLGHANAARLFAAVTMIRAIQLLTKLATAFALKQRKRAPRDVRRQAKRFAIDLQLSALVVALVLTVLLVEAMKTIGQHQIALFLPFLALGMPARFLRFADVRTSTPYYRLALAAGGLAMVLIGWIAGWQGAAMAFAFASREWIAYFVVRLWPMTPRPAKRQRSDPLRFSEVATHSAILARRLLTYRLTKTVLAIFGPIGNAAARTGRGLNMHRRIEPYLPHHLVGFLLFSAGTMGAGIFLAMGSGEPAAMVVAAALFQIGAAAANVVLLWPYLPAGDLERPDDDDDDE